jgi:hypothetical protein
MSDDLKTCSKCRLVLSVSMFYKDKRTVDGLYSACKDCHGVSKNPLRVKRSSPSPCSCGKPKSRRAKQCASCAWPRIGHLNKKTGYVMVRIGGRKTVGQHRIVMAELLGRPLLPGESVHHQNGVRHDNRPENLELWVSFQPSGQRPKDLLKWADEIIRRYSDLGE